MISKYLKGKRVVRLQAADVRKLNDTAFTLKQIAAGIDDKDEQEHLQNIAKECGDIIARYTEAPKAAPAAPPAPAEVPVAEAPPAKKAKGEPLLTE